MAATVTLNVKIADSDVITQLQNIDAVAKKLDGKTINIKVNSSGVTKLANQLTRAAESMAKITQANSALMSATEKGIQAISAEGNAVSTLSTGLKNLETRITSIEKAQRDEASAAKSAADSTSYLGDEMQTAATKAGMAERAFGGFVHTLVSNLTHALINKVIGNLREAFDTMKSVDTELTNISKVSGITGQALADMGSRAYDTASQYGVAADEYLSAVYTFQKAGLGPSAEAMGELAVKTMLVGDTTADIASQFLISANAAWEFGGNIDRLNQLVDEADYINNNYATDLAKLSSGLPRVASIAAQAGMSAEETLAALGTITAVTQESGTKAATALRALILNIEGQIGTFVDDTGEEFEVTEESVKSMQGLMEKYAQAELDAAKASGELINPMTAIKAIFEGMANSDLNDQELFQLLSGMGGKLRTNQLTALVKNYELFDEMLGNIADSAGTADREIELMMSSWERKTQVLKNTWAEFVADIVNTDTIKSAITGITEVVDGLDEAVKRATDPFYERNQLQDAYNNLQAEYDELIAKGDNLNSVEQYRLSYLEAQLGIINEQISAEEKAAAKKLQNKLLRVDENLYYDENGNFTGQPRVAFGDQSALYNMRGAYMDNQFTGDLEEYQQGLQNIVDTFQDYYDNVVKVRDAGIELTDSQEQFVSDFEDIRDASQANITDVRELQDGYIGLYDEQGTRIATVKSAIAEVTEAEDSAAESANTIAENVASIDFSNAIGGATTFAGILAEMTMLEAGGFSGFGFASGTANAPGGPTLVNELGPELISENGRAYIANGGRPGIVNLSRGAIVLPANITSEALKPNTPSRTIHAAAGGSGSWLGVIDPYAPPVVKPGAASPAQPKYNRLAAFAVTDAATGGSAIVLGSGGNSRGGGGSGGSGGGGGGRGGSSTPSKSVEEYAKELKDLLANLDKQAKLADNELDYAKEAELFEKAQEAIKAMVDRYRNAGYADDSDEILDLLNKNYDYANKQLTLYQTKWDELVKALEADTDAQEAANKLAEKQKAVEDARAALANAQKQRTIRMYNDATGQWEWVADQSKISTAEQKASTAEEAYSKEVKSQAIAEIKAMRDTVADLDEVVLGPALSAVALMAENSAEFQNFARALDAVFGVGSYLTSTEGSSNVISTMDSHNITYSFGDVALTEEEANSMSLAEIAKRLSVLKIS